MLVKSTPAMQNTKKPARRHNHQNNWIRIIRIARLKQIIVLGVNIDSPNKNHVKIGKIISPADEPINLAVQAEPVSSTMNFQEYQNATEHGAPSKNAVIQGFPAHHSDMY